MLSGRKILVTGAASGIGLATAKTALKYGAKVTIFDLNKERVAALEKELGENCWGISGDAANAESVKDALSFAVTAMGGVDGCVNNVGIGNGKPVQALEDGEFERVIQINLFGCYYGIREISKYMIANDIKGSIVNTSSLNGHIAARQMSAYSASKAAIDMLTRCAALDLAPHGIRVNAIAPGVVDTPANAGMDAEFLAQEMKWHMPLERMARPEEISEAMCFLLSDRASYISGTILDVDGGSTNTGYPNIYGVLAGLGIDV